jgi:hypothetical protein
MGYVLDATVGEGPKSGATNDEKAVYQTKVDDASFVQSGMMFAMESDLQKRFEKMSAFEIITDLKDVLDLRRGRRGTRLPSCSSPPVWMNTAV